MEERVPAYLHRPLQVLWFDTHELAVIGCFYLIAAVFGGYTWALLLVGPALVIPYKRGRARGFFAHFLFEQGLMDFPGYPIATMKSFRE